MLAWEARSRNIQPRARCLLRLPSVTRPLPRPSSRRSTHHPFRCPSLPPWSYLRAAAGFWCVDVTCSTTTSPLYVPPRPKQSASSSTPETVRQTSSHVDRTRLLAPGSIARSQLTRGIVAAPTRPSSPPRPETRCAACSVETLLPACGIDVGRLPAAVGICLPVEASTARERPGLLCDHHSDRTRESGPGIAGDRVPNRKSPPTSVDGLSPEHHLGLLLESFIARSAS